MTAFSAAATAATSSAPQKLSMLTPGRSPAATIKATPIASHETTKWERGRRGRSAFHAPDSAWIGSGSAEISEA